MIEGRPKPGAIVYGEPSFDPDEADGLVAEGIDTAAVVVGRRDDDRLFVVYLDEWMGNNPESLRIVPVEFRPESYHATQAGAIRASARSERKYAAKCIRLAERLERIADELEPESRPSPAPPDDAARRGREELSR